MSSADGWLVESESPKQAPGLCREKRRPKAGEGRAYTQNPATAQASARSALAGAWAASARSEIAGRGNGLPRAGPETKRTVGASRA